MNNLKFYIPIIGIYFVFTEPKILLSVLHYFGTAIVQTIAIILLIDLLK